MDGYRFKSAAESFISKPMGHILLCSEYERCNVTMTSPRVVPVQLWSATVIGR